MKTWRAMTIVLLKETSDFERRFHTACAAARVTAYLTANAADGYSEYDLFGSAEAVANIAREFGRP
jgi:hypothetical protein